MLIFRNKICLSLWTLTLLLVPGHWALASTYDDDSVEIELEEPPQVRNKSSQKKFSRPSRKSSRDRADNRNRSSKNDNRGRGRKNSRESSRPQGPANERFGKTKGKVRFVLVDDPTKDPGYQKEVTIVRKKISLGPSNEFKKTK